MKDNQQPQTIVITSLNLKGGVGKTHLCWLIAGVCREQHKRCLVLDLDKQGNISTTLLGPDAATLEGCEAFFNPSIDAQIATLIQPSSHTGIDCIPGSFRLEQYNDTSPGNWEGTGLERSLVDPINTVRKFYDFILIDCPADISLITYAALCASDFLMIPLETAQWGALGTQHVITAFEHVKSGHNPNLSLLGFVASRFKKGRKYQKQYLAELRQHFGSDAFETVIPDLAPFEQSVNDRVPIVLHSPKSHAANIARDFFREVQQRSQSNN